MTDNFSDFLQRLEAVKGDPQAQAVLAAEFALSARPDVEQAFLKTALDAAAVLHWFDIGLLEEILEISLEEAEASVDILKTFTFVEYFRREENEVCNIHEITRLGWRKQLAREDTERFQGLSMQAAAYFANDLTPSGRIEWIYHLLCTESGQGATELEKLYRDWCLTVHHEDIYGLALVLRELEDSQMLESRARAWALIVIAWSQELHGETAQLADLANQILTLAKVHGDLAAEVEALVLIGDVSQTLGKLETAQTAFESSLTILQKLAECDPGNIGWQREQGGAYNRVGDVLQAQGKVEAAQAVFEQALGISQKLAELDPSNAGWQRELGVALNRMGGVLQAQGKLEQAQAAFERSLAISQELAVLDPSNAGWQWGLGVAHSRIGEILQLQGKLEAALAAFEQALNICRHLVELDRGNAAWQRGLMGAYHKVGCVLEVQGKQESAQAAFREAFTIKRRLVELESSDSR